MFKRYFKYAAAGLRRPPQKPAKPSNAIHFLHIGKCAGTQIGHLVNQINALSGEKRINKRAHDVYLRNLPKDSQYFFSIREPISRFYSGFYSRKRKGRPRLYSEWSAYDAFAFETFEHANDLAESLFEPGRTGADAIAAIKSIRHTAQDQIDWFYLCGAFLEVRPPIHIIRQSNFSEDFHKFLYFAGLEEYSSAVRIISGNEGSHANDYSDTLPLSEKAKENLMRWYSQDLEFYRMCSDWIDQRG